MITESRDWSCGSGPGVGGSSPRESSDCDWIPGLMLLGGSAREAHAGEDSGCAALRSINEPVSSSQVASDNAARARRELADKMWVVEAG